MPDFANWLYLWSSKTIHPSALWTPLLRQLTFKIDRTGRIIYLMEQNSTASVQHLFMTLATMGDVNLPCNGIILLFQQTAVIFAK